MSTTVQKEPNQPRHEILIVGLNWLGDSIMTMPAIQAYRRAFPGKRLVMLVKPSLAELWPMHPAIDETLVCAGTFPEIRKISAQISARHFAAAFILPQSFRSALVPFLAKVPQRIGPRGHFRSCLLTSITHFQNTKHLHQQYESMAILGQEAIQNELPVLNINTSLLAKADAMLPGRQPGKVGRGRQFLIGLIPGAARGPAKCWPADYFAALGKIIRKNLECDIILFGSNADRELCARIAAAIGNDESNHSAGVINLAGKTSLPELAALLSRCSVVIGNDSGGVHLAAAAGAAVIVIFGITDPAKTKPLGPRVIVLQDSPRADRDIPRQSSAAEKSLKNISPEMAAEAVRSLV